MVLKRLKEKYMVLRGFNGGYRIEVVLFIPDCSCNEGTGGYSVSGISTRFS